MISEYSDKESLKKVLDDNSKELTKLNKLRICNDIAVAIYIYIQELQKFFIEISKVQIVLLINF